MENYIPISLGTFILAFSKLHTTYVDCAVLPLTFSITAGVLNIEIQYQNGSNDSLWAKASGILAFTVMLSRKYSVKTNKYL